MLWYLEQRERTCMRAYVRMCARAINVQVSEIRQNKGVFAGFAPPATNNVITPKTLSTIAEV